MPYAENRKQKIHYTVHGQGPTVVFQHGLLSHGRRFRDLGYVRGLAGYRVVLIDSLGHGRSDKPTDAELYGAGMRAGDVVAVMDDLSVERAHFVGYSMGGWMGVALARFAPERLLSLTIGGWDPFRGPSQGFPPGAAGTRILLDAMKSKFPGLVDWITPELEPCITGCREALEDVADAEAVLSEFSGGLLFWVGRRDECHDGVMFAAKKLGARIYEPDGDHVTAVVRSVPENLLALRSHFEECM